MREIIAAIPCFNEELFIGSVALKARDYADQVLVIDDGSTDKTAVVAEKAGAVVIRHSANKGKAAAVSTAFEHARKTTCKALVLLDGDGQHDPAYIPALVKPVLEGKADMVVGSRYMGTNSSIPGYRVWGHRVLTLFTNLGSRVNLTDSQSGLRAFSPKAIQAFSFVEQGLSVESEMQFLASQAGLRITEVPVSIGYYGKAKRSPIAHGMAVLNSILGLISRRIPLFFFGVPGLAMLAVGFWEGWRVIQGWNAYHAFWLGPALLAVLLCVVGALSLFTGLILHTIRSFLK
ncbi:MAG: glycosyltransferase family 2 protein [Nitrososphaerota archaeon]|nr:glycosyltransferase family 2 protein [Nitrososphaerota archaeon]